MSFVVRVACSPPGRARSSLLNAAAKKGRQRGFRCSLRGSDHVDFPVDVEKLPKMKTSQERLQEMLVRQANRARERTSNTDLCATQDTKIDARWNLDEAYHRCLELALLDVFSTVFITSQQHYLLNLGVFSLVKIAAPVLNITHQDQVKALAALVVWCRRTDELVDGLNGCNATPEILDRWEQRLIDIYEGRPHDIYDAALSHALFKFPIDLQLFKDFIEGMRMDMKKKRYENFDELYLYMYHTIGTPAIMTVQLCGAKPGSKAPLESIYKSALAASIALQLTDILRDVVEDARMGRVYLPQDELAKAGLSEDDLHNGARMGRVYLPQDELAKAGLSEDDLHNGHVSSELRNYVKEQIQRARAYADEGEKSMDEGNWFERWMVWALLLTNRQVLDTIEENDYDLRKPAAVNVPKLLRTLLTASGKTVAGIILSH